jgi:hypothetical protein
VASVEIREEMKKKEKKSEPWRKHWVWSDAGVGQKRLRARHPEDFFSGLVAAKTVTA